MFPCEPIYSLSAWLSSTLPALLWYGEGPSVNLGKADYTEGGGKLEMWGLAQPSTDYDVDSNPEGWTERLRVKGLCKLWAPARWIHCRQPFAKLAMFC